MRFVIRTILFAACVAILAGPPAVMAQAPKPSRLLLVRVESKAGFIDASGNVVITPQFEDAKNFSEGLAPVKIDGKWGFVGLSGNLVIEPQFDWINWAGLSEGIVPVGIGGKFGGIDRTGKFVIERKYEMARPFSDGLMPVRLPSESKYLEKWIYVDATGEKAIQKEFYGADSFVNGRAFVKVGFDEWALIDKKGKEVTERHFDSYDPFGTFSEDLTAVKVKGKWGYIDRNGDFVIKPKFKNAENFSEGLAAVQIGCDWGFIDTKGKLVIPARYSFAWKFGDGLAPVSMADKSAARMSVKTKNGPVELCGFGFGGGPQGYIDKTGKIVIETKFGRAFSFSEGIAQVSFGEPNDVIGYIGKRGYIDKTGEYIWEPTK